MDVTEKGGQGNGLDALWALRATGKITADRILVEEPLFITPSDVKKIRGNLRLSQSVFAQVLGISLKTLQSLEQKRSFAKGAIARLLQILNDFPEVGDRFLKIRT